MNGRRGIESIVKQTCAVVEQGAAVSSPPGDWEIAFLVAKFC
jgi:hypothetical protein